MAAARLDANRFEPTRASAPPVTETTLLSLRPSRLVAVHYYFAWLILWGFAALAYFDIYTVIPEWVVPFLEVQLRSVAAIFLAFLGVIALIGAEVRRLSTKYIVTDARIVRQDGILRRRSQQMPFSKVERVELSQGILERILRLGDIVLDTGEDQIVFAAIGRVTKVQDELSRQVAARGKI